MNRYMTEKWAWIEGCHGMRDGLLERLDDADLAFSPGGDNLTLGALLVQMGEVEHSYLQGLETFQQHWEYRNTEAGLDGSVDRLAEWFGALDTEFQEVAAAFTDEDLGKPIRRVESGFDMPVEMALDVYTQACLIFFGKATIYLKAMEKPLPPSIQEWIW